MKNLLIIYPHWPPSNLAGVHRARLIANNLKEFGWHPVILTVHEKYYEEKPDLDLVKLVQSEVEVVKTKAFPLIKPRIIGDIGLRGFPFLYRSALKIIRSQKIDFIWIPIPSFYVSLIGRMLYSKTKIPYGIDYIDPWVRPLALHEKKISRAGISRLVARILEPVAVKKASLISGVSELYYKPALDRNFKNRNVVDIAMPYGFDARDHSVKLDNTILPWSNDDGLKHFVYAGAFLPKSHMFIRALFSALKNIINESDKKLKFRMYFIGTGNYGGKSIEDYAKEYEISEYIVENRERKAFLEILYFLSQSDGVLVIGSTEAHYTASKVFQSILSGRPVFSILHSESSAVNILDEANAGNYTIRYAEGMEVNDISNAAQIKLPEFLNGNSEWKIDYKEMEKYSSAQSAFKLISGIESVIN